MTRLYGATEEVSWEAGFCTAHGGGGESGSTGLISDGLRIRARGAGMCSSSGGKGYGTTSNTS